jgi:WD40 repeat protein
MELKITFFTKTIKSVFLPIAPSRMKNMKPISFTLCYLIMSLNLVAQAPRIVINPQGHAGKVHNLLFTPDGKRLISISEDKTIRIWSTKTGEQTKKFESQIGDGYEGMLYASALSPDGKLLAVGGYQVSTETQNYIIIIDIEKGVQVATAIGHADVITSLAFSYSGTYLASGSQDGTVRIWKMENFPTLPYVTTLDVKLPVSSLSFNKQTQELAVACESKDVHVYALSGLRKGETKFAPKLLHRHKGIVNKVAYSPDGGFLASSSFENELIIWNTDGTHVRDFDKLKHPVTAFSFSFDGKILAAQDETGAGASYTIPAGTKLTDFQGHDNTVFCSVFSPTFTSNYSVASAGGNNNEIIIWNPINGLLIKKIEGKGSPIHQLAFGEGYELFFAREMAKNDKPNFKGSFDFSSFVINRNATKAPAIQPLPKDIFQTGINSIALPKGKAIQTDEAIDGRILDFRALPDGSVAVASDFSLKLFDKNGYLNKEFMGHTGAVRSVTVSKDGKYLASGGEDQSVIIWKLSETGFAPSMRSIYDTPEWSEYFSSLPVDSLTKETTKKAWVDVIAFLKANGQKVYKEIDIKFKTLGEVLIPYATLFIADDNEWVCWTPRGYFSCSSAGAKYFGWHLNRGIEKLADFYDADQYFEILYHPKEMAKSIIEGKRVEEIMRESGQRIFDLGKLARPSAAFFESYTSLDTTDLIHYVNGELVTKAQTMPVSIEVFDGGGGIKELNIYHNDKLIISDTTIVTKGEGDKVVRAYTLEMTNDINEFSVKVLNHYKVESRADIFKLHYEGEIIATSSLYVLSVGINKYQNTAYELNYAQADAKAFTEKIVEQNKGIFKAIHKTEIYDAEATRGNILKGFKNVIAKAKADDVFVFYYAGHGTIDEQNGSAFYLVPTDVTKLYGDPEQLVKKCISDEELRKNLTLVKAQKQIVLMDACHSGAAVANMKVRAAGSDEKAIVTLARSSGVVILASSGTKQFATEFETLHHGTFTYALLEALDGKADRGDGQVTINEIKLYMDERVPELTQQYGGSAQYPTGYITGNDFPISVPHKQ